MKRSNDRQHLFQKANQPRSGGLSKLTLGRVIGRTHARNFRGKVSVFHAGILLPSLLQLHAFAAPNVSANAAIFLPQSYKGFRVESRERIDFFAPDDVQIIPHKALELAPARNFFTTNSECVADTATNKTGHEGNKEGIEDAHNYWRYLLAICGGSFLGGFISYFLGRNAALRRESGWRP